MSSRPRKRSSPGSAVRWVRPRTGSATPLPPFPASCIRRAPRAALASRSSGRTGSSTMRPSTPTGTCHSAPGGGVTTGSPRSWKPVPRSRHCWRRRTCGRATHTASSAKTSVSPCLMARVPATVASTTTARSRASTRPPRWVRAKWPWPRWPAALQSRRSWATGPERFRTRPASPTTSPGTCRTGTPTETPPATGSSSRRRPSRTRPTRSATRSTKTTR